MTAPIDNAAKLAELKRELHQRGRVYPRLIEAGKITSKQADRQCDILRAIIRDYEQQAEANKQQEDLFR